MTTFKAIVTIEIIETENGPVATPDEIKRILTDAAKGSEWMKLTVEEITKS